MSFEPKFAACKWIFSVHYSLLNFSQLILYTVVITLRVLDYYKLEFHSCTSLTFTVITLSLKYDQKKKKKEEEEERTKKLREVF